MICLRRCAGPIGSGHVPRAIFVRVRRTLLPGKQHTRTLTGGSLRLLIVAKARSGLVARMTQALGCVGPGSPSPDKRQHRANLQRGCRCNSSGIRLCSSNSAALPGHSASRRRNEKHRNLALSSPLLHQFTGALQRGRKRARDQSAYAIDATRASSAPSNRHHRRFARGGRAVSSST